MRLAFAPLTILLLAACGQPAEKASPPPEVASIPAEVTWKWIGMQGADPAEVRQPSHYTLEFFLDGRYAVRADCNSGAGSWSQQADSLALKAGPMTMAACDVESFDQRYLQLLAQVEVFELDDETLRLVLPGGMTKMVFAAMPRMQLAGTSWLVRAYNNGHEAVTSVLRDTELTIEFGEDGRVAGSAGCNRFNGSFRTAAQTVSFSPLATTRRMCMGEGVVDQETAFLGALSTVASWEIRGERAQLRAANGALAVDLVSAVTGVALIRTRQALPPDAVLTVQLLDVSRADAPAILIGEETGPLEGASSPLPFAVEFDPAEIEDRMSYGLRATVTSHGELLFTTMQSYPVLTGEGGQFGIELRLDPPVR